MARSIGVLATRYIWAGVVEDSTLGAVLMYPEPGERAARSEIAPGRGNHRADICSHIEVLRREGPDRFGGRRLPRHHPPRRDRGVAQSRPAQRTATCGNRLARRPARRWDLDVPVAVMNDADALAAGMAVTRGALEPLIRVWYLGDGIGFGRYPARRRRLGSRPLGGHARPQGALLRLRRAVGHLEGIMGNRAMRLRFLDMEPEEVFAAARQGDARAADFVKLWHRALAAATATSVHIDGPGRFYIAGPNADFVDLNTAQPLPPGHGQNDPPARHLFRNRPHQPGPGPHRRRHHQPEVTGRRPARVASAGANSGPSPTRTSAPSRHFPETAFHSAVAQFPSGAERIFGAFRHHFRTPARLSLPVPAGSSELKYWVWIDSALSFQPASGWLRVVHWPHAASRSRQVKPLLIS